VPPDAWSSPAETLRCEPTARLEPKNGK
jgi:hypothetical protein